MKIRVLLAALAMPLLMAAGFPTVPGDQATFNKGVAAYDSGRYEEAFQIFSDLADKDDLAAMRNVALMLRHGKGVEKNPEKAIAWYERAAEAGLVTAQADLGVMLLDGEAGKPDIEDGMKWLTRAAQAGHATALFRLAEAYEKGVQAPQDLELAKTLYGAAAGRGHRGAAARLAALLGLTQLTRPAATKAARSADRVEVTSVKRRRPARMLPPPSFRPTTVPAPAPQPSSAPPPAKTKAPGDDTKYKTFGDPALKPSH